MEKTSFTEIALKKGVMHVYDFGKIKLHAYKTNDLIADECFLIQNGSECFMIENPCFLDNIAELENYVKENFLDYKGAVIAYHGAAGASFFKDKADVKIYSTKNADEYNHSGDGAGLAKQFTQVFGESFDNSLFTTTDFIEEGPVTICGVELKIILTREAFDIEIPEINCVYTHMLGHDVHSIVAGSGHADAIIKTLEGYIENNVNLILTSHYVVEDLADVKTKIEYLSSLKNIAVKNADAESFKAAVKNAYPDYKGLNYLDMTTSMFFK